MPLLETGTFFWQRSKFLIAKCMTRHLLRSVQTKRQNDGGSLVARLAAQSHAGISFFDVETPVILTKISKLGLVQSIARIHSCTTTPLCLKSTFTIPRFSSSRYPQLALRSHFPIALESPEGSKKNVAAASTDHTNHGHFFRTCRFFCGCSCRLHSHRDDRDTSYSPNPCMVSITAYSWPLVGVMVPMVAASWGNDW